MSWQTNSKKKLHRHRHCSNGKQTQIKCKYYKKQHKQVTNQFHHRLMYNVLVSETLKCTLWSIYTSFSRFLFTLLADLPVVLSPCFTDLPAWHVGLTPNDPVGKRFYSLIKANSSNYNSSSWQELYLHFFVNSVLLRFCQSIREYITRSQSMIDLFLLPI